MSRTHKDLPSDGRRRHALFCPGHGAFDHDPVRPDPEDCFFCSVSPLTRLAWHCHVIVRDIDEAAKAVPGMAFLHWILKPLRHPLAHAWTPKYLSWHAGHSTPSE